MLTGCTTSPGGSTLNDSRPVATIFEAKTVSVAIQNELVDLSSDLNRAPTESQTAPIGQNKLPLRECDRQNYYYYPGITSVVFNDAGSVIEFHQRIYQHLRSEGWAEIQRETSESDSVPEFRNEEGFKVYVVSHQEPDNLRVVIRAYSPCVELPPDLPKAGGPEY